MAAEELAHDNVALSEQVVQLREDREGLQQKGASLEVGMTHTHAHRGREWCNGEGGGGTQIRWTQLP